ncbi:MAG: dTDP-4-dehydrorhamnose reductase [Coriobacteriales bacterium]|jgi:dTDP-4-dehydrorhamnose reductase|nr:dTDP-4-dehydrorhamnose reductase [Coriobacteriales bacterium]
MNILITGSNGQLGSELRRILTTGTAQIGPIPPAYHNANTLYCGADTLDITNKEAVLKTIQGNAIDLIINCAGFTDVDACEVQQECAYSVNATGPRYLAEAAQATGATLVHISTDYVFAGDDPRPRAEDDPCDPHSVYGHSKYLGEQQVAAHCAKHFIVRTAWLYGPEGANFAKTILRLARDNGAIKVVDDQFGNPTNANDLAYELLKIAQTGDYGIYHCTNNGTCSWFEFASAVVQKAGIPCEKTPCATEEFPRPAKRPTYSALDNARLRATIGDEMRPWQAALDSYLATMKGPS